MVAITSDIRTPRLALHLVPPPRRAPRYGLRRAAALAVAGLVLVAASLVADAAVGLFSPGPGTAVPVDASSSAPAEVHIVQPGETLWAIAVEVAPDRDPRAVVDELVARNGSAAIEAGQRLVLP